MCPPSVSKGLRSFFRIALNNGLFNELHQEKANLQRYNIFKREVTMVFFFWQMLEM